MPVAGKIVQLSLSGNNKSLASCSVFGFDERPKIYSTRFCRFPRRNPRLGVAKYSARNVHATEYPLLCNNIPDTFTSVSKSCALGAGSKLPRISTLQHWEAHTLHVLMLRQTYLVGEMWDPSRGGGCKQRLRGLAQVSAGTWFKGLKLKCLDNIRWNFLYTETDCPFLVGNAVTFFTGISHRNTT
jgi:hypothetical protein